MTEKYCKMCNEDKDIIEFAKKTDAKDGLQTYCKSCINEFRKEKKYRYYNKEYQDQYRRRNLEKCAEKSKKYYWNNQVQELARNSQYRKRKKEENAINYQ